MIVSDGKNDGFYSPTHSCLCSTIPKRHNGFTAEKWFFEEIPRKLIDKFVGYILDLSLRNSSQQRQKFLLYMEQKGGKMLDYDAKSVGDSTLTDFSETIDGNDEALFSTQQCLLLLLKI